MSQQAKAIHNQERLLKVIQRPHISEKSTLVADKFRQYVFEVESSAEKNEIKNAVESLFRVQVEKVQVLNVKEKQKVFKKIKGRRKGWKKAYVTLKDGQQIDFAGKE